jgi:hypothetical protein
MEKVEWKDGRAERNKLNEVTAKRKRTFYQKEV